MAVTPPPVYFLPEHVRDVEIGPDQWVPERFRSKRRVRGVGDVELMIETKGRRARVVDIRITEADDEKGVASVALGSLRLQDLLEIDVSELAAFRTPKAWETTMSGGDGLEEVRPTALVATRRRVSDERLALVLEAYDEGGIQAVKDRVHVGERHAWRLLQRAREVQS